MRAYVSPVLEVRGRRFDWGARTYVMAIVNLSPDSFSGDGVASVADAVAQAQRFAAEGADVIDVGGQSTRPGFEELSVEAEAARVVPAIEAIVAAVDLPVSIDAYRAPVVVAALKAGAAIVNDVWGFRHDAAVARAAAAHGAAAVVMHNQRGRPAADALGDVRAGFEASLALARDAGLPVERLVLDPGFGFGWTLARDRGKNLARDFAILRRLGELREFGLPLLVGTSRKSSIGAVLDLPPERRLLGTAATVALAIANGADIVRVHEVAAMVQVCRMTDAIVRAREGG